MRGSDWKAAITIRDYWVRKGGAADIPCPILETPEQLVGYLDEVGIRPGHALDPCEKCGGEHRWAFLRLLLESVLQYFPSLDSTLLRSVDELVEKSAIADGGREAYWRIQGAAEQYFASIDTPKRHS